MLEINKEIDDYILNHTSDEDEILKNLRRETNLKIMAPRMLSGHLQGQLLTLLSKIKAPNRILEIGTFTGYSAICLAKGLVRGGKLFTIDVNDELADFSNKYIKKAELDSSIEAIIGPALDIIPKLKEKWDLVFIDADKREYLDYYNAVIDNLNPGGIILVDDVLWDGKVIEEIVKKDKQTKAIVDFNNYIQEDERVENIIIPLRHGLSVIRKK
ncbi:MAG: O-methyltransferase [Marinifilaceae bacterium]|jgi:predicted O-methyltransferase YrrM|nr:O-methyltransferase [Marinifilaceae bacterium]